MVNKELGEAGYQHPAPCFFPCISRCSLNGGGWCKISYNWWCITHDRGRHAAGGALWCSLICSCSRGRAFNWDCGNASKSYGSSMLPCECLRFPEITQRWITCCLIPRINKDESNWHISRSRVLHIPSDLIRERAIRRKEGCTLTVQHLKLWNSGCNRLT